jgi:threonine dehydrogenase-like Zn-dependent dehydrogenase
LEANSGWIVVRLAGSFEPAGIIVSAQDHHTHLAQADPLSPRQVIHGLKPGGITVIVGAGAMGRIHVDLALSYEPAVVIATDLIQERLEIARRLFGFKARQLGVVCISLTRRK